MKTILTIIVVIGGLVLLGNYFYRDTDIQINQSSDTDNQIEKEKAPMSFFITSANPGKGGDLGGLAGADAYCSQLGEKSGTVGKTWRAYLSTTGDGGVNARDRIGSGPWYNAKGELIANTVEELHGENFLTKVTALNENGEQVQGRGDTPNMHDILTGSLADGKASSTALTDTTCANWTSSSTGFALVGHHDRVGRDESEPMKSWNSSHKTRGCDMASFESTGGAGLFYCFAQE